MELWNRWNHLYPLERSSLPTTMLLDHFGCFDGVDFHQNAAKLDDVAYSSIFEYLGFDCRPLPLWAAEYALAIGK